jgi:hypothetical protein
MVSASPRDEKNEAPKTLEARSIFVSHSHADRELANALGDLVDAVFSGLVVAFTSSDPGPTGGLMPGDEWFARIHTRLREAEAVWVLATPQSITRPWIYWEAGTGRALCPGSVVVVRVGLQANGVPSPLSAFQSYDGLSSGDDGIGVMLNKVAAQIGMKLAPVLVGKYAADWIAVAKAHKPEAEGVGPAPAVAPEQLDRLEAIIARLEAAAVPAGARPSLEPVVVPSDSEEGERRRRIQLEVSRAAHSLEEQRQRERWSEIRRRVVGEATHVYDDADAFVAAISAAPADTLFDSARIDDDGDAEVNAARGEEGAAIYLRSTALPQLTRKTDVPERTAKLIEYIVKVYQASLSRRAPSRCRQ